MIQTTIRLPEALHRKLKEAAGSRGLTLNALLIQTLWEAAGAADPEAPAKDSLASC